METTLSLKKASKKTGRFANIEEAVKFKNAELMKILKDVDLNKLSQK